MFTWFPVVLFLAACLAALRINYLRKVQSKELSAGKITTQKLQIQVADLQAQLNHLKQREADLLSLEENDLEFKKEYLLRDDRLRIAQELHDDTVQRIIMVRFRLINAMHYEPTSPAKEQANLAIKELQKVVDDLRYLIDNHVKPEFEIHPLTVLLQKLADDYTQVWINKRVILITNNTDAEFELDPEVVKDLYYIAHETVVNAIKSSVANTITIALFWGAELKLRIVDDGQSRIIADPGRGTQSIKARVKRIGAEMEEFNPPSGYRLIIKLKRPA
jgi:two-component system, NarL family, sensor histidine kinase LiaS